MPATVHDPLTALVPPRLSLLGGFSLVLGDTPVALPTHACRVLAYLSLDRMRRTDCDRSQVAERLWSNVPVRQAYASLRTALWRIRRIDPRLVRVDHARLRLGDLVDVDVHRSRTQADRLLSDEPELHAADAQLTTLVGDLLPGWDEDWLLLERERIRQLQLHALEALVRRLRTLGRYSDAIDVAFAVIAAEPLRESGHAALVDTYLSEGNVVQAHRQLDRYAVLLRDELGLAPSPALLARMGVPAAGSATGYPPASTANPRRQTGMRAP
jgi:DNA-binding SARP family transcriptional activator